ncbi:NUDIX domain-containing protein [Geomicrobium sp. JCM 19039]|uniref:NUDIX domain-containing protein n=1 Tax=Geomicrobium sp. JCM 19039 TaxID=1460636 RepID=UPI00045F3C0D|nr:NUDIX domain-containing protein [Geomicrobium sp. JCM 19039]GAK14195.1 mutator MutT protein [Geomicrobium sp. JCM 19039]
MKTRQMAVALINNQQDEYLFLNKRNDHDFLAGFYVPIGGHIRPEELINVKQACLREVYEETGLEQKDLHDIKYKYLLVRHVDDEIRLQYVFTMSTSAIPTSSEEGDLYWLTSEQLLTRRVTPPVKAMVEHFERGGKETNDMFVGTLGTGGLMQWSTLIDC